MQSKRTRLDRFMSQQLGIKRQAIRPIIAQGRIRVDGCIARDVQQTIHQFSHVTFDEQVLQDHKPCYVMMNKPKGVVSATKDQHHKTVIDLLERKDRHKLHIAGRLDFNSTGLILLTNDGRWSRELSIPKNKVYKRYQVEVEKPLDESYIRAFSKGIYFNYEGITTKPAALNIMSSHICEVSLTEGRYHQVKRMFGHFQNAVLELHRQSVGNLILDQNLLPGQSRELSKSEINNIYSIEEHIN